ncbi:hypothetical protein [Zobellella denitrificans]
MIFINQLETSLHEISNTDTQIAIVGEQLDERGERIKDALCRAPTKKLFELSLDANSMHFNINKRNIKINEIYKELDRENNNETLNSITIDATTLGVAELLYTLRWIQKKENKVIVNILYAEPEKYPSVFESPSDYGRHQFKLSSSSIGYKSLPGFTRTVPTGSKSHLIALLGFERVRLGQLMQKDEGAYIGSITPIFGVPGFKPSYDKHSAHQNIDALLKHAEKPEFSSANNPYETFLKIKKIKDYMPEQTINVAPIGTKPMAIGACLFVLKNLGSRVGVMYDHPIKTRGRSEGISKIHSYRVLI